MATFMDDLFKAVANGLANVRPPKSQSEKDMEGARASARVIDRLVEGIPNLQAALQAAKETFDPQAIRRAAAALEQSRALLMLASDAVHRGLAQPTKDRETLVEAEQRARQAIASLAEQVEKSRSQADQLAATAGGALSQLPKTAPSITPEETRARAARVAPLGLCDDKSMQSPESHACPLNETQRESLREVVGTRLAEIAENWRAASSEGHTKVSLEPLLKKSGVHPLLELLINVAMSWFTGQIGALALGAVNLGRSVRPTENFRKAVDTISLEPVWMPDLHVQAPDLNKPSSALITGLASKLTEHALKGAKAIDRTASVDAMFRGISGAATSWGATAKLEVRQLPDPVLVSLAEGLEKASFSIQFFAAKIATLVSNFKQIEQIGVVKIGQYEPLTPVRVLMPSGEMRLALVRAETVLVDNPGPSTGHEPGEEQYERRSGKFIFETWVDKSLTSIALAKAPAEAILYEGDLRWAKPPTFAADAPSDVQMLATEPSTGGSS